ncbi:MAG: FMN-binding protein [Alloprevotella sp.]|nr:FMN-binding protein [Alloprevotella sp.]
MQQDTIILSSSHYAPEVQGFGGPVPLQIHLSRTGVIDSITALPNNEDPQYWDHAKVLLQTWNGMTPEQALRVKPDAVTGATFSSRGIIDGVHQTLEAYVKEQQPLLPPAALWGLGVLVVLTAVAAVWYFRRKMKVTRHT